MSATDPDLTSAVRALPAGRYGVGVSGGADSVGLLLLLVHQRPELYVHVVHLDHQMRGPASTGDAEFVRELARRWGMACTLARREELEVELVDRSANKQAFFRALRHLLFARVVRDDHLDGVILAHQADDQAETIMQRLLRGSSAAGLGGMAAEAVVGGLRILRPLLPVTGQQIRDYLQQMNQPWREDASNQSGYYQRNRVRQVLRENAELTRRILEFHAALADLRQWSGAAALSLPAQFAVRMLADLPGILGEESARRWLMQSGIPAEKIDHAVVVRLITMASDAASAPRQQFPGRTMVRRRRGTIFRE